MTWHNNGNDSNSPWEKKNPFKNPNDNFWENRGAGNNGSGEGFGGPGKSPEDYIADIQNVLRGLFGGRGGGNGNGGGGNGGGAGLPMRGKGTPSGTLLTILLLGAVLLWLLSGFYTVQPNQIGLNLIFGRFVGKATAGLNYNYPYPIGVTLKLPVFDQNIIDVGQVLTSDYGINLPKPRDVPEESLMLTGDENIADVKFRVSWQIDPARPEDFAFNIRRPEESVKAVAESAMREIIGRSQIQRILTSDRKVIEPQVQELMQKVLDDYHAGVTITQVQLQSVDPPAQVISAFRDVTAAQQDLQRLRNQAETYANSVVPEARGEAARIVQTAEGYRTQTVAQATGQASRFTQVLEQYRRAPDLTRQRLYYETMEQVLGSAQKIILESGASGKILPLLPLASAGGMDMPPLADGAATSAPSSSNAGAKP